MAAPVAGTFSPPVTVVLASSFRPGPTITLDNWYFTQSSRMRPREIVRWLCWLQGGDPEPPHG